jgi:hypothetical protein
MFKRRPLLSGPYTKRYSPAATQVCKPGSVSTSTKFEAEIYCLTKEEGGRHTPFFSNYRPQFFFRTADISGSITLPEVRGTRHLGPHQPQLGTGQEGPRGRGWWLSGGARPSSGCRYGDIPPAVFTAPFFSCDTVILKRNRNRVSDGRSFRDARRFPLTRL